jgi:glyoxylase-like metal-dependent hydrolase (beta-lactamase superfamily II)
MREDQGVYELIQLTDKTYYIHTPTNVGVIRTAPDEVCLIDSGRNEDEARLTYERIRERDWKVAAIYNTHSHADHIGGSHYIQQVTGCKVYLTPTEIDLALHPCLEPSLLFGAYPPRDLRNWYILAQKCNFDYLTDDRLPPGLTMFRLPGHVFHMVGFRTDDGVVFLADAIMGQKTLERHPITFLYDTGSYLETLRMIKKMKGDIFVPSHAEALKDVATLAQMNIDKLKEISDHIIEICEEPLAFEEILQKLLIFYHLKLNFMQYALLGSTVRSYLAWLKDIGRLDVDFEEGKMLWRAV